MFRTGAVNNISDTIDVDSFCKGGKIGKKKGGGKKRGKGQNLVRILVPTRTWFVGTGKKSHWSTECCSNPKEQVRIRRRATQSRQRNTKERHGQMRELFGTRRPNCSCETTTATSSRTLSGQHCLRNVLDHFRRLVGMDIRHECGDFGISIGCKDWHRNRGERM